MDEKEYMEDLDSNHNAITIDFEKGYYDKCAELAKMANKCDALIKSIEILTSYIERLESDID